MSSIYRKFEKPFYILHISVFDEDASDSNFLEVYKEYGNYEGDDKVPDLDVIK